MVRFHFNKKRITNALSFWSSACGLLNSSMWVSQGLVREGTWGAIITLLKEAIFPV